MGKVANMQCPICRGHAIHDPAYAGIGHAVGAGSLVHV